MDAARSQHGSHLPDAVRVALERAREKEDLGAFWHLDPAGAEAQSERLRAAVAGPPPLAGVPVGVKDLLDVRGLPTTGGLAGERPQATRDAEAVRRLRAAGGVPIGKTAMDPLGATTGGQAPGFPACVNPVDPRFSPGGSSSGSAVAVAAGIVPLAIGTDTAGSIRVPAAYTGVVGFKPAHRAIPKGGCMPAMPGFDTIGVLATSVEDCLAGYRALAGRRAAAESAEAGEARELRVGVASDLLEEADGIVASVCGSAIEDLERSGSDVERLELGWRGQGLGVALAWELASTWGERVEADPEGFPAVIRDTVEFGRSRGAEGHRDAIAGIARARERLRRRVVGLTALVCPTVPIPAPDRDRESTPVSTRFTRIFNALGWPAFSIPAGADGDGRPIGIQVAGPPTRTADVIAVARRIDELRERPRHT